MPHPVSAPAENVVPRVGAWIENTDAIEKQMGVTRSREWPTVVVNQLHRPDSLDFAPPATTDSHTTASGTAPDRPSRPDDRNSSADQKGHPPSAPTRRSPPTR